MQAALASGEGPLWFVEVFFLLYSFRMKEEYEPPKFWFIKILTHDLIALYKALFLKIITLGTGFEDRKFQTIVYTSNISYNS